MHEMPALPVSGCSLSYEPLVVVRATHTRSGRQPYSGRKPPVFSCARSFVRSCSLPLVAGVRKTRSFVRRWWTYNCAAIARRGENGEDGGAAPSRWPCRLARPRSMILLGALFLDAYALSLHKDSPASQQLGWNDVVNKRVHLSLMAG